MNLDGVKLGERPGGCGSAGALVGDGLTIGSDNTGDPAAVADRLAGAIDGIRLVEGAHRGRDLRARGPARLLSESATLRVVRGKPLARPWVGRSVASMRIRAYALAMLIAGCGDNLDGDEPFVMQNPARDQYDTWLKIEPPGVVCGNGSQYKIFVNFSDKSDNLVVVFEPGGACWDYDSCAGRNGIRGAANPNGIMDNHWERAPFISPFLSRFDDTNPSREWNMVYVPYCTGDVHTGAKTVTYSGGGTDPDLDVPSRGPRRRPAGRDLARRPLHPRARS